MMKSIDMTSVVINETFNSCLSGEHQTTSLDAKFTVKVLRLLGRAQFFVLLHQILLSHDDHGSGLSIS